MRSAKRKYMAETEAGVDATRAAVELKTRREALKQFIAETHRRIDSSRTSVSGFGHSQASKAAHAMRKHQKMLQFIEEDATLKANSGLPKKLTGLPNETLQHTISVDIESTGPGTMELHLVFLRGPNCQQWKLWLEVARGLRSVT